jgi:hypothetical protein
VNNNDNDIDIDKDSSTAFSSELLSRWDEKLKELDYKETK